MRSLRTLGPLGLRNGKRCAAATVECGAEVCSYDLDDGSKVKLRPILPEDEGPLFVCFFRGGVGNLCGRRIKEFSGWLWVCLVGLRGLWVAPSLGNKQLDAASLKFVRFQFHDFFCFVLAKDLHGKGNKQTRCLEALEGERYVETSKQCKRCSFQAVKFSKRSTAKM